MFIFNSYLNTAIQSGGTDETHSSFNVIHHYFLFFKHIFGSCATCAKIRQYSGSPRISFKSSAIKRNGRTRSRYKIFQSDYSRPHNGVTALFVSMSQSPAVSITVMETPATAKQLGEMTLENMEKGGIASTPLEEKDGMWHSNLSGKGKGSIWFGDNNGIASVTVITGDDIEKAEDFFSALSPKTERLFPKKAQ